MLKRLFADIEVAPNKGYFWGAGYKINIGYNAISQERSIICICWKWENDKKVSGATWKKPGDDRKMIEQFLRVAKEADEIVFHNGDKFDMPWIRTRALFHGVDMPISIKTIDTLKIARRSFRLNSNRLDYIAQYLGVGSKIKTEYELWKSVTEGDKLNLKKMLDYCKGDVKILEKVYKKLKNHIPAKTHYGVQIGKDRGSCPECGSSRTIVNQYKVSAAGYQKVSYRCADCGKYHTKPYSDVQSNRTVKARP